MLRSRTPDINAWLPPTRCRGRHRALPSSRRDDRFYLRCGPILTPSPLCFAPSLAWCYVDGTLRPRRVCLRATTPTYVRSIRVAACECSDRIPSHKGTSSPMSGVPVSISLRRGFPSETIPLKTYRFCVISTLGRRHGSPVELSQRDCLRATSPVRFVLQSSPTQSLWKFISHSSCHALVLPPPARPDASSTSGYNFAPSPQLPPLPRCHVNPRYIYMKSLEA